MFGTAIVPWSRGNTAERNMIHVCISGGSLNQAISLHERRLGTRSNLSYSDRVTGTPHSSAPLAGSQQGGLMYQSPQGHAPFGMPAQKQMDSTMLHRDFEKLSVAAAAPQKTNATSSHSNTGGVALVCLDAMHVVLLVSLTLAMTPCPLLQGCPAQRVQLGLPQPTPRQPDNGMQIIQQPLGPMSLQHNNTTDTAGAQGGNNQRYRCDFATYPM